MLLTLLATALLFALAAPAQAASPRVFEETFGSAAQPAFDQAQGMAVDYDTGELYVIDIGAGVKTLSRWHADGTPAPFEALGSNVIDGKGAGGCAFPPTPSPDCDQTPEDGLSFPAAGSEASRRHVQVAIDESGAATDGNIYITQTELGLVDIFAGDGRYLGQLTKFKAGPDAAGAETNLPSACGVAVDEDGAVYVADGAIDISNQIHVYEPSSSHPANTDNVANFHTAVLDSGNASRPCALAAGAGPSDGFLFFSRGSAFGPTYKVDSSTGLEVGENPIVANNQSTLSVSPQTGHLFAGEGFFEIKELDVSDAAPVEVSFANIDPGTVGFRGFALAADGQHLYANFEGESHVQVFGAPLPLPVVVTEEATEVTETSATLNGSVDPEGGETEACPFEYISDAAYQANKKAKVDPFTGASSEECAETVGNGTEPVDVHVDLTGLEAGELFHYRLSATTVVGTATGDEMTFATTVPPTIEDEHATAITDTEATIKLRINPRFYATTFHLEYGPGSSFAQSTPETAVGADGTAHPLAVPLAGLSPGTTYEWRVVASSANGLGSESAAHSFTTYRPFAPDTDCPNQALRSGASASLPDCRAYEMVSPVDKNGLDIVNGLNGLNRHDAYIQAAPAGEKIAYSAVTAFGDQLSSRYYNQYIATRGAGGWATSGINAPLARQLPGSDVGGAFRFEREITAFSEDLCSMWLLDYNTTPLNSDGQAGFNNLYRRQNCAPGAGIFEALTIAAPPEATGESYVERNSVQGFSADGTASVFVARAKLTEDAADVIGQVQVYLRLAGDPKLRLVSVLPDGEANVPPAGRTNQVGGGSNFNLHNAVSADGRRIFWSADLTNGGAGKLYLRQNPAQPPAVLGGAECAGQASQACTIEVSEGAQATFWDATPSGSAVLYSEGSLSGGAADLYRFDVASQARTKLAGKVYGLAGSSEDLARTYLISGEDHDEGGPAEGGQPNLYLHEGGDLVFIATLAAGDVTAAGSSGPFTRATRVTPDGHHIVFQSRAQLTGFDNTDTESGEAAVEVFVYEANGAGGALRCASCNPAGIRPRGGELPHPYQYPWVPLPGTGIAAAAWIPTWEHPLHASRILSEDGNRVFFHSFDSLLPNDNNGTVQDVYQWEAPGTGSCDTGDANYFAANGGCIDLISSGESSYESEFFEAGADGSDVFFTTDSSLVPQDPGLIDLYDARVGGGYPPPVVKAACQGDACQSPPPPPEATTPASGTYVGPGDVTQGNNCRSAARRAARFSRQARRLRRRAARRADTDPRAARQLRRKAQGRAAQAKRKSRAAKRCRRANRRAAR